MESMGGFAVQRGFYNYAVNEAPVVQIASAANINVGPVEANTITVSGTTTITSLGVFPSGALRRLVFSGALTLTHNATSLILPSGANIATAANDGAEFVSLGGGNWRCTSYTRATGAALASSPPAFWTESRSTASPNNVVNASQWIPNVASADGDAVLVAKAAGAIQGQTADGTTAAGDKRGQYATDWQHGPRGAATQVASGNYSNIGGGNGNTASGAQTTVAGGGDNSASATGATVGGGTNNISSGPYSSVPGGNSNTTAGSYSNIGGGNGNSTPGDYANVPGGESNLANSLYGQASGNGASSKSIKGYRGFSSRLRSGAAAGYAQRGDLTMPAHTTNATPVVLTTDQAAASTDNQLIIPAGSASGFRYRCVAYAYATDDFKVWEGVGGARTTPGGVMSNGTTAPTGTGTTAQTATAGASTWSFTAALDTPNTAQSFSFTGQAATDIDVTLDIWETYVRA